jgi:hypothetical protein
MPRTLSIFLSCTSFLAPTALLLALPPGDDKPANWREVLPAKELRPLAEQIAAALTKPVDALVGGKLDDDDRERAVKKARGLALLLVAGAQTTASKDAADRGPVRNAAFQLDRALRGGKFAEAKAIVAALPAGKGFETPAFAAAPLVNAKDREDAIAALMVQCRTRSYGGLGVEPRPAAAADDGLEAMLKVVADKGKGTLKPDELARFAFRLAVLAEAARSLPPASGTGEKDPRNWLKWSADMRDASLALAEAARKGNATSQAALRVVKSCNDCHKVFRDN